MKPKTLCLFLKLSLLAAVHAKITTPNLVLIFTDDQGYGDLSCLAPLRSRHQILIESPKRAGSLPVSWWPPRFALLLGPLF